MNFHPSKCKVLSISKVKPPLAEILPCIQHFYTMSNVLLDYTESEKDLGIIMNSTLNLTSPILIPPRGEDWKLEERWQYPG